MGIYYYKMLLKLKPTDNLLVACQAQPAKNLDFWSFLLTWRQE